MNTIFSRMLIATLVICASNLAAAETLTISGSTTVDAFLMAPHRREIESLSGQKIVLTPNRTDLGIKQLYDGTADIAMASTDIENARKSLHEKYPKLDLTRLQGTIVHRTRSALTVHPSNPVKNATLEQVKQVLQGAITNWKDLHGEDRAIRLVIVREGGGAELSIISQLLGGTPVKNPTIIRTQIASQINKIVEQEQDALGLVQFESIKGRGVDELITDALIHQRLSLVWLDEPTPAMQAVIEATKRVADARLLQLLP
jgi:phosphate transport system substrate-binding protein